MAKLLSLTYVLLSFVSTSGASTECQDGKCDSADNGDAGVLLQVQGGVRVSPERTSIPKVFLTFPMKSIPHGPALLQMKKAAEQQTFCFTTNGTTSAEYEADGAEVIEHAVHARGTGGQEFNVYSKETFEPGEYCCPGTLSTNPDDLVEDKCTKHAHKSSKTSLLQAKMIIQASSVAEDGEAVEQIAQLAKQSPDDVAIVIDNDRVYDAVLNQLGDHVVSGKIFYMHTGVSRVTRGVVSSSFCDWDGRSGGPALSSTLARVVRNHMVAHSASFAAVRCKSLGPHDFMHEQE